MKKLLAVITFCTAAIFTHAQSPLPVGSSQLNVGLGLSEWGVPFYLGIDYSVHPDITIGGEFSYRSYNDHYNGLSYNHNIYGFSGNGNYHFNTALDIPQNWDFYAGLNLGFYAWSSPSDYNGSHSSGLGLGAQIGGRYYFTRTAGVNLEFGGGNAFSGGKIGFTFKL
jgi:hypothetical protein